MKTQTGTERLRDDTVLGDNAVITHKRITVTKNASVSFSKFVSRSHHVNIAKLHTLKERDALISQTKEVDTNR